jgi:hypothetical protein
MGYGNTDQIDHYFISSLRLVAHALYGIKANRSHRPNSRVQINSATPNDSA